MTTNVHKGFNLLLNAASPCGMRSCQCVGPVPHNLGEDLSHYLLVCLIVSFIELLHPQCLLSVLQHHLVDPSQQSKNSCSLYTLSKAQLQGTTINTQIHRPRQQRGLALFLYAICLSLKSILIKKSLHKKEEKPPKPNRER